MRVKQSLTSNCQLDHQLHEESGQERRQQDEPEGAEALPAADQRGSGRRLRGGNFQGECQGHMLVSEVHFATTIL